MASAAAIVALLNVGAPLLIWRTQRIPARPRIDPLAVETLLAGHGGHLRLAEAQLQALGYVVADAGSLQMGPTRAEFAVYTHGTDPSSASLTRLTHGGKPQDYVEFTQVYADGSMLDVNNAKVINAYPRLAGRRRIGLPDIDDVIELHRVFRALRNQRNDGAQHHAPAPEGICRLIERSIAAEADALQQMGLCHCAVDAEGMRRLTLYGAYRISWKFLFPGNWLLARMLAYQRRRLLADCSGA